MAFHRAIFKKNKLMTNQFFLDLSGLDFKFQFEYSMMLFIGTGIYEIPSEQFSLKLDRHAEILSENFATER